MADVKNSGKNADEAKPANPDDNKVDKDKV